MSQARRLAPASGGRALGARGSSGRPSACSARRFRVGAGDDLQCGGRVPGFRASSGRPEPRQSLGPRTARPGASRSGRSPPIAALSVCGLSAQDEGELSGLGRSLRAPRRAGRRDTGPPTAGLRAGVLGRPGERRAGPAERRFWPSGSRTPPLPAVSCSSSRWHPPRSSQVRSGSSQVGRRAAECLPSAPCTTPGSMMIEGHVAPELAVGVLGPYLHHVHVKDVAPAASEGQPGSGCTSGRAPVSCPGRRARCARRERLRAAGSSSTT